MLFSDSGREGEDQRDDAEGEEGPAHVDVDEIAEHDVGGGGDDGSRHGYCRKYGRPVVGFDVLVHIAEEKRFDSQSEPGYNEHAGNGGGDVLSIRHYQVAQSDKRGRDENIPFLASDHRFHFYHAVEYDDLGND